jgi:hypothetical protein
MTSHKFISFQHQLNQFALYLRLYNHACIHHSRLGCTEPSHPRFQTGANNRAVSPSDRACDVLPPRTAPGQGASTISQVHTSGFPSGPDSSQGSSMFGCVNLHSGVSPPLVDWLVD